MKSRILLIIGLCLSLTFSVAAAQDQAEALPVAADLEADVLVQWMDLLYQRVEANTVDAPAASRLYAYAGITAYQSVLGGIPEGFSLSGQLTSMPDMPYPEEGVAIDWISSANGALSTVISSFFPSDDRETQQAITALRDTQGRARERAVGEEVVAASLEYGDSVGEVIKEWIATDGYTEAKEMVWEIPTGDLSFWVPTREGMKAVEPYWGTIRPFALYYADACAVQPNMEFSTDENSTFYAQALEVKNIGDRLTPEQKDIARFWVDTPGQTGAPAGHWVMIQNQMVDVLDLKLERASMMYALVGAALGDSFISAWSLKYQINLLRPETYIQEYIDPRWEPFIASPGFPEYPSGHSVASAAAAEVLTGMFGTVAFTDNSVRRHGMRPRSFTSFEAAATEAAISRIYGGIHFRAAVENGIDQGRCVGRNVLDYIALRSRPQGE